MSEKFKCRVRREKCAQRNADTNNSVTTENEITEVIIGCAIKLNKSLGPGLLESAYEECMDYELRKTILEIERQKLLPLIYEEVKLDCGYRLDFMVNKKVVIEIKPLRH